MDPKQFYGVHAAPEIACASCGATQDQHPDWIFLPLSASGLHIHDDCLRLLMQELLRRKSKG